MFSKYSVKARIVRLEKIALLHRDFKMFKLWYKARKHSTTASQSSPRL